LNVAKDLITNYEITKDIPKDSGSFLVHLIAALSEKYSEPFNLKQKWISVSSVCTHSPPPLPSAYLLLVDGSDEHLQQLVNDAIYTEISCTVCGSVAKIERQISPDVLIIRNTTPYPKTSI